MELRGFADWPASVRLCAVVRYLLAKPTVAPTPIASPTTAKSAAARQLLSVAAPRRKRRTLVRRSAVFRRSAATSRATVAVSSPAPRQGNRQDVAIFLLRRKTTAKWIVIVMGPMAAFNGTSVFRQGSATSASTACRAALQQAIAKRAKVAAAIFVVRRAPATPMGTARPTSNAAMSASRIAWFVIFALVASVKLTATVRKPHRRIFASTGSVTDRSAGASPPLPLLE